jgi:hypothetical protein
MESKEARAHPGQQPGDGRGRGHARRRLECLVGGSARALLAASERGSALEGGLSARSRARARGAPLEGGLQMCT